jgi:hypothetical protein
MAQFARPDADTVTDVWTTTPLWSKIDEGATGDGTRVVSDANPITAEAFVCRLSDVTDPVSSTGHIIRAKWRNEVTGSANLLITAELREGYVSEVSQGTLIGTLQITITTGQVDQTDTYTLSAGESNSIGDYTDLFLRCFASKSGGGSQPQAGIDFIELEVPDATGPQTISMGSVSLASAAQGLDVAPGAITAGMNTVTLASAAQGLNALPGGVTVPMGAITLASSPQALTPVNGAISVPMTAAMLASSAQALNATTISTIPLSSVTLASSAQALTVLAGGIAVPMGAVTLAGSAEALTASPGAISVAMGAVTLASSPQALTVAVGAVSVAMGAVTLTAGPQVLTVSTGALVVAMGTVTLASTAQALTVTDFQVLSPDADVTIGSWTDELGGTTNIYQSIDEVEPNDADFVQSEESPAASAYKASITPGLDPLVSESHFIEYRYRKLGGAQINLTVRLKEGAATVASWSHTDIPAAWTEAVQELSSAEADAITDYGLLDVEFEATEV